MRKQSTKWVVYFFVFALILVDCNLASGNSSHFLRRAIKISRKLERKICNYYRTRNFFELGRIIEKNLIDIQKLPKKHYNDCFYRALGSYYYFDKEYKKALKSFLKIENYTLNDIINLSAIYIKLNDLKKAERILLDGNKKYSQSPGLLYNLAILYIKKKNYYRARKYLLQILNLPIFVDIKQRAYTLLKYIGY
jgi:tetratricopeptide (TPR) repeat protein